jgi:hypothetical protein
MDSENAATCSVKLHYLRSIFLGCCLSGLCFSWSSQAPAVSNMIHWSLFQVFVRASLVGSRCLSLTVCANECMFQSRSSSKGPPMSLGSMQKVIVIEFLMLLLKLISNQQLISVFHLAELQLKNSIIVLVLGGRK